MICVLLNKGDVDGVKLSRMLQNAGRSDIKLISAEELVYAPSFCCGFKNGKAFFSVQLFNGFVFSNKTVSAVINRIQYLPFEHSQRFKTEDQAYAKAELDATFVFLFSIFPNSIFNISTPAGFCGRQRSLMEWMALAAKSGFKTSALYYENKLLQTTDYAAVHLQNILYFRGRCYGEATVNFPQAVKHCTTLGQLCKENVVEIFFYNNGDDFFFESANTQPSFKNADSNFINDVNKFL